MTSSPIRKKFYCSSKWKTVRSVYAESKNFLCERCLEQGIMSYANQVHHKVYLTDENLADHNISLNFDNLELLCDWCHAKEHKASKDCDSNLFFDENGNLKQR